MTLPKTRLKTNNLGSRSNLARILLYRKATAAASSPRSGSGTFSIPGHHD